ncbi:MAG: DUF3298 and DUF4163 domain-containing protein [Candidatus Staskawiczbacteria bacterium]|nr:DUF3298 and DUF4163 domain-containing protein [Candidatus Staskawiczbacteria bacterium]
MKKSKSILLIILLIIIIGVGFLLYKNPTSKNTLPANKATEISIQDKKIIDSTKPFVIKIVYPQITGLDDFNQKSKAIVDKEINDFKTNSLANDEAVKKVDPTSYAKYPRTYELDITYDKGEVDKNIVSVVFDIYNFEGGAHGASYFVPLNYNPETKQEIKLTDLFPNDKNYLKTISDYCIKDLTKQITEKMESTEGSWISDGASPKAENFQFFLINPSTSSGQATLTFYFPQYQVAPGAAGDFKVTMPR